MILKRIGEGKLDLESGNWASVSREAKVSACEVNQSIFATNSERCIFLEILLIFNHIVSYIGWHVHMMSAQGAGRGGKKSENFADVICTFPIIT